MAACHVALTTHRWLEKQQLGVGTSPVVAAAAEAVTAAGLVVAAAAEPHHSCVQAALPPCQGVNCQPVAIQPSLPPLVPTKHRCRWAKVATPNRHDSEWAAQASQAVSRRRVARRVLGAPAVSSAVEATPGRPARAGEQAAACEATPRAVPSARPVVVAQPARWECERRPFLPRDELGMQARVPR